MTLVVVDASAIVDYLLDPRAQPRISEILQEDPSALHAPHLIDLEVLSTLREMVFDRRLEAQRATALLIDFGLLPIERHSHEVLARRIWQLRDNLTAYDASYVALAELLDAPLLTRDHKLTRTPRHRARIEYID